MSTEEHDCEGPCCECMDEYYEYQEGDDGDYYYDLAKDRRM